MSSNFDQNAYPIVEQSIFSYREKVKNDRSMLAERNYNNSRFEGLISRINNNRG